MTDSLFSVDKDVIVLTGVTGLLGIEYAKAFLERGARVYGIDIRENTALKDLISKYPETLRYRNCNLTDKPELLAACEDLKKSFGTPTVLINNAAIDSPPDAPASENGPFESYPETSWDKVMDVNVKGVFLACQVFGGTMAEKKYGSIVNISSIYGVVSPDQNLYEYRRQRGEDFYKPVTYSVSKSAILNLTRYLAVYWAKKSVRVNTLVIAGVYNNQDEDFLSNYRNRIPIGRMAEKNEYAGACIFLASKASQYMTGSQLVVDGGWTAI